MPTAPATISVTGEGAAGGKPAPLVAARRRPGLGRAAVGALLVTASAVGVAAAWRGGTTTATDGYVVAARNVHPGATLDAADLRIVAIDLPDEQRRHAFTDASVLDGAVAVGVLRAGQVVQSTDVAPASAAPDRVTVSLAVEPGNAMNGDRRFLRPGDRVDVWVTDVAGGVASPSRSAAGASVVDVLDGGGGLGSAGRLTVVLAVPPADAGAVAAAGAGGSVSLVRTTGLAG